MAVLTAVDWKHADPDLGVYALYNDFFGIAYRDGEEVIYNLSYRIKVTSVYDSVEYIKTITPIDSYAVFKPLELVKDTFFKGEYGGFTDHSAPYSYNKIQIEVGASFSTVAADPPTFAGYDTDDTFYVYNGYELPPLVANYRNPNWYDTEDIKLPKVLKEVYVLGVGDPHMLSFLSEIYWTGPELLSATELIIEYYNASDTLISTSTTTLSTVTELTGIGYWNIDINPSSDFGQTYTISKIKYVGAESTVYSEEITLRYFDCNPKYDPYRLMWFNQYGGLEQLYFNAQSDEEIEITKGKKVHSDGVNYSAQVFADIKNINNPNLKEYGNTAARYRTFRTEYLSQEQVDALQDLYKSPIVIMADELQNEQAVLVQDTSYKIESVKDGLVKVEVKVQIANTEPIQRQ